MMKKLNKIAVIPDVHGKDFWKEAKEKVDSLDKIIFIGDYLDAYPDNIFASLFPISVSLEKEQAARKEELSNFKEILEFKKAYHEKVTLLLGNHDIGYWLDKGCSRQASGEMYITYKSLFENNIDLFKITEYVEIGNEKILFSHAGILRKWLNHIKELLELDSVSIKSYIIGGLFNELILKYKEPVYREFLRWAFWLVGPFRGGNANCGSIVWADSQDWENEKNIFGDIKQIFGHNRVYSPDAFPEGVQCIDGLEPKILYIEE